MADVCTVNNKAQAPVEHDWIDICDSSSSSNDDYLYRAKKPRLCASDDPLRCLISRSPLPALDGDDDECESEDMSFDAGDEDDDIWIEAPNKVIIFPNQSEDRLVIADVVTEAGGDRLQLAIPTALAKHLRKHQQEAIEFLWKTVILPKPGARRGCILAHQMGLGKTLTVLTFLQMLKQTRQASKALVLCPAVVVHNWLNEADKWREKTNGVLDMFVFSIRSEDVLQQRTKLLHCWNTRPFGCLVMTHEMYTRMSAVRNGKNARILREAADIVVIDEGHKLTKNLNEFSKALAAVATRRRVVLTGTPVQNNLEQYHVMIEWVRAGQQWTAAQWKRIFVDPINAGKMKDSSPSEKRRMLKAIHILERELQHFVHRRTVQELASVLKRKDEYTIFCPLQKLQEQLYIQYLTEEMERGSTGLLMHFHALTKLANHPKLFVDWIREAASSNPKKKKTKPTKDKDKAPATDPTSTATQAEKDKKSDKEEQSEEAKKRTMAWVNELVDKANTDLQTIMVSAKMQVLFEIVGSCLSLQPPEKILVFSQFTQTLDLIEKELKKRNLGWYRLDGKNKKGLDKDLHEFQTKKPGCDKMIYLISIKAGGVGINLTSATRVVIFDVNWNPTQESQAVARAYRFGQEKPVTVYRLIAEGTAEHSIYVRQCSKTWLAEAAVENKILQRNFRHSDLNLFDEKKLRETEEFWKLKKIEPDEIEDKVLKKVYSQKKDLNLRVILHHSLFFEDDDLTKLTNEEKQATEAEYQRCFQQGEKVPAGIFEERAQAEAPPEGDKQELDPLGVTAEPPGVYFTEENMQRWEQEPDSPRQ